VAVSGDRIALVWRPLSSSVSLLTLGVKTD
jgi:hypothetical protein